MAAEDLIVRDVPALHRRAVEGFGARVRAIGDRWLRPTPCHGWDVRALVNHLVNENRWTPWLLEGRTLTEAGDRFDGDLLGADPVAAWDEAAAAAVDAVGIPGVTGRRVQLSSGDDSGQEYVTELFADHLIHTWDLAHAIGADERLDPELVTACAGWFAQHEAGYRRAGVIAPRVDVPPSADEQTRLLAAFGRQA